MLGVFLTAIALLLVFEGIIPFLSPNTYKRMMESILSVSNRHLRTMGLIAMLLGLLIMYLVHSGLI